MTEAEQMAVYNLQVLGIKAEVAQRFATIVLMVIACVALVFAIMALWTYVKKNKEQAGSVELVQPQATDLSYSTLNLDSSDATAETVEDETNKPDGSAE